MSRTSLVARVVGGGLAGGLALLLTGCSGLATTGPVRAGLRVDAQVEQREVQQLPSGPRAGASAEEVLTGFVRAAAVSFGDVTVARGFLGPRAAEAWFPDVSTVIRGADDRLGVTELGGGRYRVSSTQVAQIDDQGQLTIGRKGQTAQATLRVGRVNGQWRVTQLPRDFGRWMTQPEVDARMRPFDLHYLAGGGNTLIPQRRWFPLPGIVSRLARAQLAGPPEHLLGAVPDDLPVRLDGDVVPVNAGVATVPVRTGDVIADPVRRRRLYAELVATLTQVRGLPGVDDVSSVAITSQGTMLDADGVEPPVVGVEDVGASVDPIAPSAVPLLRRGQRLYPVSFDTLVGDSVGPMAPVRFPPLPRDAGDMAQSASGSEIALVDVRRTHLHRLRAEEEGAVTGVGTGLTRPVYDGHNWLWVGGRTAVGSPGVWVVPADRPLGQAATPARQIFLPWLARNRVVRSVRISPEGQRIAIVTTDRAGRDARVDISGVERRSTGKPWRLSGASRRMTTPFEDIRDVVWISMSTLGVLGTSPEQGGPQGAVSELGGYSTMLGRLPGATGITTFGSRRTLVLESASGLWVRAGTGWKAGTAGDALLVAQR